MKNKSQALRFGLRGITLKKARRINKLNLIMSKLSKECTLKNIKTFIRVNKIDFLSVKDIKLFKESEII